MAPFRLGLALASALACLWATFAEAGQLRRADLERFFPAPYMLGEKDDALPIWPIFKQNGTSDELIAYVFESVDLAPIPGFSGTPIDLLVALTPDGAFLDVKVISHNEPVFVDGLGPEPLFDFVKQYAGKSLKQSIRVGPASGGGRGDEAGAVIDGVAKATASVRIVNESLLVAGLAVARAKLGFAQGRDPSRAAKIRPDVFEPMNWAGLVAARLRQTLSRQQCAVRGAFRRHRGRRAGQGRPRSSRRSLSRTLGRRTRCADGRAQPARTRRPMTGMISKLDGRHALLVISSGPGRASSTRISSPAPCPRG